jgi:hypothetical protein
MTEDEAKTKWCPLVRWKFSANSDQSSSNRETGDANPHTIKGTRCIASGCMAWRFNRGDESLDGRARGYCGAFQR